MADNDRNGHDRDRRDDRGRAGAGGRAGGNRRDDRGDRAGRPSGAGDDRRQAGDRQPRGAGENRGGGARGGGEVRRNAQGRERNRGGERSFSASAPARRGRTSDPARLAAFETLRAVSADDAYANLVLPARLRRHGLSGRDAGFATELAYGSLRSLGTWDAILARCVDRPLESVDAPVRDALRLGVHQLLAMRVPAHAALDQTVALAREAIGAGPSGFINAVLRRVSERSLDDWLQELTAGVDDTTAAGLRYSHPTWVVRAMRQALVAHGRDAGELTDLLTADNAAPVVNLVALPGLGDLDEVLAAGAHEGELAAGSASIAAGDLSRFTGVQDGTVRIQDVGSQLVARVLAAAPVQPASTGDADIDGTDGERWLDGCAGPGGKAALLAALALESGATVTANEPAPHRADLVRRALGAVPEAAWRITERDARDIGAEETGRYDRVLVDVPCSGLGALRRRPEARWRRTPADVAQLGALQRDLLRSAIAATRPGGVVAYATCSPHPAETVAVVDDVLRAYPGVELLDTPAVLDDAALVPLHAGGIEGSDRDAPGPRTAQLWPHVHGTDAMFLALLRVPANADAPSAGTQNTTTQTTSTQNTRTQNTSTQHTRTTEAP
ncbi:RsmB/NOP family class I SAM-dependent RNA methyltransferase [Tersicoccus sp. Bi-70]|uniref:RsmB/NOP family class I SAM-dependent RNA methyltransferase n=1 Tax=Tersicoccus sp. Bi-70 TaxID=1897634 RepID=UPI000977FC41|nr:RsmB/NOP family class I SAM-dependent RNA methyltransferase [Tersicoccus sp. Bi-70]OMH33131.1 methyltransferase [Tersicoccus sp. Bi-70]